MDIQREKKASKVGSSLKSVSWEFSGDLDAQIHMDIPEEANLKAQTDAGEIRLTKLSLPIHLLPKMIEVMGFGPEKKV